MRRVALMLFLLLATSAHADSKWWEPVKHPDGFSLVLRKRSIEKIPYTDPELKGGMREEGVFGFCADYLHSPLFLELRNLQVQGKTILYARIEAENRAFSDSIRWEADQRLAAVLKNGQSVPAERILAAFKPNGVVELENSSLRMGGGSILQIYPQSKRGFHPPFQLEDIRMEVLVNGEDRSRYMVFVVMPKSINASAVDHWVVETIAGQAALSGANGGGRE